MEAIHEFFPRIHEYLRRLALFEYSCPIRGRLTVPPPLDYDRISRIYILCKAATLLQPPSPAAAFGLDCAVELSLLWGLVGQAPHYGVNPSACFFHWFHVQPLPCNPVIPDPKD